MKRLIVCCDGTWNRADQEHDQTPCPTNVVSTAFRIAKQDGQTLQIIFYDQGVGTGNLMDRFIGGAFGEGLEDNIYDAYRFLIANYEPGDELYLFGFSRGAYTVRSLAGLIRKCGILKRTSVARYRDALQLYRSLDVRPDDVPPVQFRTEHSCCGADDVSIKFMGVWDTVGALGIPLGNLGASKRQFHDVELSKCVQNAFQALAVDEHRSSFAPALWAYKPKPPQVVEQMWFVGAHSDVGGGYAQRGLSDIALQWMIEKAKGVGLRFDPEVERAYPVRPILGADIHNSKKGLFALAPSHQRPVGLAVDPGGNLLGGAAVIDPTQAIHPDVLTRWDDDASYRPVGLLDHFKRTGDERGRI